MQRLIAAVALFLIAIQAQAASEYPPTFRWQTITTDHFYIHFHQGEEELARRAAMYAEGAHERVAPMLNWIPRERTHVVLTDHVDASNGNANPFPNNRIEVVVTAPGADPASPIGYYDDWLNVVITHEYTHIIHLDQARGFARWLRLITGRSPTLFTFPNELSPLWMIEGIATLSESENTQSGRLKGTFVDMVLRTAAVEDRWASEAQASGLGPYWPTGNARYYYGSKFLSWLATTHGMDRLTKYFNEYSSNILPFRVNATAEDVYGTSLKSLWRQWGDEQQRIYKAERDRLAADGLTQRRRLTNLGYQTEHPILSSDGTRIAYSHQGPYERATIRIREVASGRDVTTHSTNTTAPLSWRADGRAIAYSDLQFVGSFQLLSDLYVWEIDHRHARRITKGARLRDPAFTPDGRTLIAVENRVGTNRLVAVDVASGAIQPIVTPDDDRQFQDPMVSHDGKSIAVAEWHAGSVDVVLYTRNGERMANLTESTQRGAMNASPRFSPDDKTIWFSSDVTGVPNIYAASVTGGNVRRLTNVYGGALYPTSVDGRRFFYSDYSANGFDLAASDVTRDYPVIPRIIPASVVGNQSSSPAASRHPLPQGEESAVAYSPWRSLRPRWWLPVITSTTVNGESKPLIGFTTSGGDVIARHTYEATITNRSNSLLYSYDRFYPTLTFLGARYDDDVVNNYTETTNRLLAQAKLPYRRVQWQISGSVAAIRDHVSSDANLPRPDIFRGTLQGFRAGLFFNNAHEYLFSISPERGVTASVDYENLSRALGSDRSLQQIRGDLRGYLTIPYANSPLGHHVLAARAAGGKNFGDFVFQRELKVGGDSTGELTALDLTEFPVRGFDSKTLRGQSAVIGSVEYRFPLYEIERGPTTWPIFFNRIHGDVFTDAGRAGGQTIASAGAEGAADFIIANGIAIRYRIGVAWRLTKPGKGDVQPYVSFGTSF